MSIIQVTGTGGRVGIDRTSFLGASIPKEISAAMKHLKKMDKAVFRQILQVIVAELQGDTSDITSLWQSLQIDNDEEETIAIVYSGLRRLLQLALKKPKHTLKQELFREDLEEIQRETFDKAAIEKRPHFPCLDNLCWRVDVGISTSVLNRVLEPTILMEMTLSDGTIKQFEVPVAKFHQLRYNVAHILKEMSDLEKRSILKIQDQC